MDRDVYLILIGAGISLASSIVTLILQFLLGLITERIREKRAAAERKSREIVAAIMGKDMPMFKKIQEDARPQWRFFQIINPIIFIIRMFFRTLPLWVGILIFICWVLFVFLIQ